MAKPILVIDDFKTGITYDETESVTNGFNDITNIDLKATLGVVQLSRYMSGGSTNAYMPRNYTVGFDLIPKSLSTTTRQSFFVGGLGSNNALQLCYWDPTTETTSVLYNPSALPGASFSEVELFQNTFFFSGQPNQIASCAVWSTGNVRKNISANGSTKVTLIPSLSGYPFLTADKSLEGGTLYYTSDQVIWSSVTISSINVVTPQDIELTCSGTVISGTYFGYIVNGNYGSVKRSDGTTLNLTLPNGSVHYRPMINFINNLYIGDGQTICQIDNLKANFNTTGANGSINVGQNYTAKQFEQIGGYMYILADNYNSMIDSDFSNPPRVNSKLYIWNGISNEFSNIIDIGAHCYSIKAIENKIYALIDSGKNDGVLFTYFNGSDFPTIAKLQTPYPKCPINSIAYDRGRFYFVVNQYDVSGTFQGCQIYSYSSYAIEQPCITKDYSQVTTDTKYTILGIDFVKTGTGSKLMMFDNASGLTPSYIKTRSETSYMGNGFITTQKYEITPDQFGKLVRGVQVNCKETMPEGTIITVKYRGDEEANYTTLSTTITSTNQNSVIWGIMKRYRKIQLQIQLTGDTTTARIVKIMLF